MDLFLVVWAKIMLLHYAKNCFVSASVQVAMMVDNIVFLLRSGFRAIANQFQLTSQSEFGLIGLH